MNTRKLFLPALVSIFSINTVAAQITNPVGYTVPAPNYFFTVDPAPDPALRHNRLLKERTGEGVYTQVGNYKVKGSPNLFGGRINGNMFAGDTKAFNILLNYNTYNQELGFYSTSNPTNALYKEPGEVDSFFLLADKDNGIEVPLKFIYGSHIGSKEKSYYQEVYAGTNYSVYKKYRSELGYVSDNYVQSELRQFDLVAEYFYTGADKKLKKIKPGTANVVKEFKDVKDLKNVLPDDAFSINTDGSFEKVFAYLNQ